MMKRCCGIVVLVSHFFLYTQLPSASADLVKYGDAIGMSIDLLSDPSNAQGFASIYGASNSLQVVGDTYNVAPLIQTAASAFYLSTPGNVLQTFSNGVLKPHGASGTYAPGTTNIVVSEALTSLGGNQFLVQVELTSVGATGPNPWVPTGVTGPGGAIFTSWRMDLGALAAAADRLTPAAGLVSIDGATVSLFNSAGSSIFSGSMGGNNFSNLTGLAGAGLVGLGGANIAGFDMASMQLAWTYTTVPEPTTGMTVGLFGMIAICWRKRRS